MSHIVTQYQSNGEWLHTTTNPDFSGSLISIRPAASDVVPSTHTESPPLTFAEGQPLAVDLGQGKPWAQTSSESGDFTILAPDDGRRSPLLQDWQLEIRGLPRIYRRLNMKMIGRLFGWRLAEQLDQINQEIVRESIGDVRAVHRSRGPLSHEEVMTEFRNMPCLTTSMRRNLNDITAESRATFLRDHVRTGEGGSLVVARNVLIS